MTLLEKLFNGDLRFSNLEEIFMILAICKYFDFSLSNNLDSVRNGRSQKASESAVKPTQKKWVDPLFQSGVPHYGKLHQTRDKPTPKFSQI